jgi:hypothetical protein
MRLKSSKSRLCLLHNTKELTMPASQRAKRAWLLADVRNTKNEDSTAKTNLSVRFIRCSPSHPACALVSSPSFLRQHLGFGTEFYMDTVFARGIAAWFQLPRTLREISGGIFTYTLHRSHTELPLHRGCHLPRMHTITPNHTVDPSAMTLRVTSVMPPACRCATGQEPRQRQVALVHG